jgi:Fe2+ or Zn2+ uptake regulation protein
MDMKEFDIKMRKEDLTLQMLADHEGVDLSTVYRWLRAPERLTVGRVESIAKFLHVDKQEFTAIFYPEFVA